MNKWPKKIYKQKAKLGSLVGQIWYDRWHENIWFQTNEKLYVPLQVDKLLEALPFGEVLNITFKLIYSENLKDLIPDSIGLLKRIPKTDYSMYENWYVIPIIHGDEK